MLFKDNNHITKNYYLNLFSANADIIKNGNNNFMYEWNIRDLKLGKYCEIALVQLASINTNLSPERQYPPKLFNTSTSEVTNTGEISNIAPNTYYKETITLNTNGITYGAGTYSIYASTFGFGGGAHQKKDLFNYVLNDVGGFFSNDFTRYNPTSGYFERTDCFINDYYGDWVILKIPNEIILTRFRFYFRPTYVNISPSLWRCYGSSDGIIWTLIKGATNDITPLTASNYSLGYYEHKVNENYNSYNYICFIVNKVVSNVSSGILNFAELQLFGKEEIRTIERQYPPKLFNANTNEISSTEVLNKSLIKETITLNTDNITYGSGIYEIYSSSAYPGEPRRNMFNFNINDIGGAHALDRYTNGAFNRTDTFIINNYFGDFVILKLPQAIKLTKYRFYPRTNIKPRSPSLYKFYGSNDGINFNEIIEASNDTIALTLNDYQLGYFEKSVNTKNHYIYIGFVVNKLIGGDLDNMLNFAEFQLFGTEDINTISPIMWYQFDGSSTDMLLDSSGNNYHLTNNGATFDGTNFKRGNGSASLNTGNSLSNSSVFNLNSKDFSISCWMYIKTLNTAHWAVCIGMNTSTRTSILLARFFNNSYIFSFGFDDLYTPVYTDDINKWVHICATYKTGTRVRKIYKNGVEIASGTAGGETNTNSSLLIGKLYSDPATYNGNIDDLRIYDYVLSPDEVKGLYNGIDPTQNNDNKFIIRALNTYDDGYDSQNTTSAILFADNELISPQKATYHKLNTYDLNRISLQVSNDIETNKPYNGWDSNIQFGAVLHIRDYKEQD